MGSIRQALFTGWHFMRWIRLLLGIFFLIQAIQMNDKLVGIAAIFFLITSSTNTGCCAASGCAVPPRNTKETSTEIMTDRNRK